MSKIEIQGRCDRCGVEKIPIKDFGNETLCKFCLATAKEQTSSDFDKIEKPVDDFNALIRKCVK